MLEIDEETEDKIFEICYDNVDVQKRLENYLPKKRAKRLAENCEYVREATKRNHSEDYLQLNLDDVILTELET